MFLLGLVHCTHAAFAQKTKHLVTANLGGQTMRQNDSDRSAPRWRRGHAINRREVQFGARRDGGRRVYAPLRKVITIQQRLDLAPQFSVFTTDFRQKFTTPPRLLFPGGLVKLLDLPPALNVHHAIRIISLLILVHSQCGRVTTNPQCLCWYAWTRREAGCSDGYYRSPL
jgi:hypothetical protein